jgi:hypothetical protein
MGLLLFLGKYIFSEGLLSRDLIFLLNKTIIDLLSEATNT